MLTVLLCGSVQAQSDWWMDEVTNGVGNAQRDSLAAQQPLSDVSTWQRMTFGGAAAIQLGSFTLIGASPKIGYRITKNLTAGLGGTYYFKRNKVLGQSSHIYGSSLFARHLILPRIFIHVESEHINLESGNLIHPIERFWTNMLWVGGGYYTAVSPKMAAGLMVLYDLTENTSNPYSNPDIRGGITFGF